MEITLCHPSLPDQIRKIGMGTAQWERQREKTPKWWVPKVCCPQNTEPGLGGSGEEEGGLQGWLGRKFCSSENKTDED